MNYSDYLWIIWPDLSPHINWTCVECDKKYPGGPTWLGVVARYHNVAVCEKCFNKIMCFCKQKIEKELAS